MGLPQKLIIQMSGAPGSGKSTIANLLARTINGVVINHDLIKSYFLENGIDFLKASKLTYDLDWLLAEDMIKQKPGRNIIVDSTCNFNETLDNGTALAQKYGYAYRYIECRVDNIDLLDKRLRDREPMRCQRTGVDLHPSDKSDNDKDPREVFKNWIENPVRPDGNIILVDSSCKAQDCLDYILKQIAPPTAS